MLLLLKTNTLNNEKLSQRNIYSIYACTSMKKITSYKHILLNQRFYCYFKDDCVFLVRRLGRSHKY